MPRASYCNCCGPALWWHQWSCNRVSRRIDHLRKFRLGRCHDQIGLFLINRWYLSDQWSASIIVTAAPTAVTSWKMRERTRKVTFSFTHATCVSNNSFRKFLSIIAPCQKGCCQGKWRGCQRWREVSPSILYFSVIRIGKWWSKQMIFKQTMIKGLSCPNSVDIWRCNRSHLNIFHSFLFE